MRIPERATISLMSMRYIAFCSQSQSYTMSNSCKRKAKLTAKAAEAAKKPRTTLNDFFPKVVELTTASMGPGEPVCVSRVALSPEQTRIHNLVVGEGKNVFFTGAAG